MINLTEFKPQLCGEGELGIFLYNNDVVALEPKIDGIRIILEKRDGKIKLYSRMMRDWSDRFSSIIKSMEANIRFSSCVIDGEMAVVKGKKILSSSDVLKKKLAKDEKLVYFAFDIIEAEGHSIADEDYFTRKNHLWLGINECDNILAVPHKVADNDIDVNEYYKRALKRGFEGIVLKNLCGYSPGTRYHWLKRKPFETKDLVIADKKLRKDKQGWSYGLSDSGKIVGRSSSKLDLELGVMVEVKYEKLYKKKEGYSMRFPEILRVRKDLI